MTLSSGVGECVQLSTRGTEEEGKRSLQITGRYKEDTKERAGLRVDRQKFNAAKLLGTYVL